MGLWITLRVPPPWKGMTSGYVMVASGAHSQPALFPRAGQELRVAGHSSLPPHSGISGPNHFQMAVGPLRSSSSNGGASMPVSSCHCSWRVCAGGLWFRAKFCLLGTPPIPAQGSGSMLWGGCHWLVEDGSLAPWAADVQAQSLWALPTVALWPGRGYHIILISLQVSTYWLY